MAVAVSASSVRMKMLTAPVARFAAMNTGNMFKLIAAKICDIGRWKLPDERAQGRVAGVKCCLKLASRNHLLSEKCGHKSRDPHIQQPQVKHICRLVKGYGRIQPTALDELWPLATPYKLHT